MTQPLRRIALFVAIAGGGGVACSFIPFQEASAVELDCEPAEIQINYVEGGKSQDSPLSWEATCKGKRYLCSRIHQRALCDEIPPGVELDRGQDEDERAKK